MALIAGLAVALVAVFLVLEPVLRPSAVSPFRRSTLDDEDDDPTLVRRDTALAALKEIEFDQATGKLSDDDYERLRAKYTTEALDALRATDAAAPEAGPAPDAASEPPGVNGDAVEALIASARASSKSKGRRFCIECGSVLEGSGKFCVGCGTRVAA
ncbi:MAG: hypothetical protein Q8Q85_05820 [Gemmatimonadales bacterium]|nr:hypothetical protein [Gemmatimonadales bacterium]